MALIIGLGSICSSHDYYGQGDGNFGTCRMKKRIFFLGILYGFVFIYIYACIFASQLTFKRSDFPWFSLVWSGFFFKKKTRATSSMLITFTVFNWKVKANKFQVVTSTQIHEFPISYPRQEPVLFLTFSSSHFFRSNIKLLYRIGEVSPCFSRFHPIFRYSFNSIVIRGRGIVFIRNRIWDAFTARVFVI